jgi:UTP--glucose-1-phosphate uridylyltransferase
MQIKKALITAAGSDQRRLALQTLVDRDGNRKTVMEILVEETQKIGIEEIAIIIHPGDLEVYHNLISSGPSIRFIEQDRPLGYGYAILCGAPFTGNDYFMHLVGDHLYVNYSETPCSKQILETAIQYQCAVSSVVPTREHLIPNYGTIGGKRINLKNNLYQVNKVIEKPTPTLAEQRLIIPGLRSGYYLCFSGMHILPPTIMDILRRQLEQLTTGQKLGLSESLDILSKTEKYLAVEVNDQRFDIGTRYGLFKAQLALALHGNDRDQVLSELLEFFVARNITSSGH